MWIFKPQVGQATKTGIAFTLTLVLRGWEEL
jgi:hypothetical protein